MSKQQATLIKALSADAYIDAGVYRQEQDKIFARNWQFTCHVEKLRNSGDFVVCEVAGESLIVIRENEVAIAPRACSTVKAVSNAFPALTTPGPTTLAVSWSLHPMPGKCPVSTSAITDSNPAALKLCTDWCL